MWLSKTPHLSAFGHTHVPVKWSKMSLSAAFGHCPSRQCRQIPKVGVGGSNPVARSNVSRTPDSLAARVVEAEKLALSERDP